MLKTKRSSTGRRFLLPARPDRTISFAQAHHIPTYGQLLSWTSGRGSVIRRIWVAVLGHTAFAAAIVCADTVSPYYFEISSKMMTVLGVVIGFVISYRAASGYDRYWMGRTAWSDVIRNSRALGRLIWFHVPPSFGNGSKESSKDEMERVMKEKRVALDLVEAFSVALKHHVRGESGIYIEDLYFLVRPLHEPKHAVYEAASCSCCPSSPPSSGSVPRTRTQDGIVLRPAASTHVPHVGVKYRPRVAGEGRNLPLEIIRCLSEWMSVLDTRGTVPGSSLGAMMGCLTTFEDSLTTTEKILTVPLPFGYASQIRSTVWIYLFLLPFQLVGMFRWFSIPGVLIASFIYLGFLAAGDELEQPFGYDENDLDLDMFCHDIIHADIEQLKNSPCKNAYFTESEKSSRVKNGMVSLADFEEEESEEDAPGESIVEREATVVVSQH